MLDLSGILFSLLLSICNCNRKRKDMIGHRFFQYNMPPRRDSKVSSIKENNDEAVRLTLVPLDVSAFLPGGPTEGVPGGPGHTHPEDLPRLEVPHPLPAAEEEPDRGVGLVPPIRCKHEENEQNDLEFFFFFCPV